MGITPSTIVGKIQFAEAHVTPWTDNAVPMGSTASAVLDWKTKVLAARAAFTAQQDAELARKNATNDLNLAMDAMDAATASIIGAVRSTAKVVGDSVYSLASLPAPSAPSPVPPPGTPTDFSVTLIPSNGSLHLAWKCPLPANSTGVMYMVERKLPGAAGFTLVGGSGKRLLIDSTVPAGTAEVTYRITATRTTGNGTPATYTVQWGNGGAGNSTAAPVVTPRIAA